MLNKLQKSNKGFTIIEVMIVLAIAGLIILIVLLAIPALQRNSRNTAIKNDVTAVTSTIGEFASNNDGASPTAAGSTYTPATGTLVLNNATGTQATGRLQANTAVAFTGTPGTTPGSIVILLGQRCNASNGFAVTASNRSAAVLYNIETAGGVAPRCADS